MAKVDKILGWYVYFVLKIYLGFVLRKTRARLNFKIDLGSLHISPGGFFELSQASPRYSRPNQGMGLPLPYTTILTINIGTLYTILNKYLFVVYPGALSSVIS